MPNGPRPPDVMTVNIVLQLYCARHLIGADAYAGSSSRELWNFPIANLKAQDGFCKLNSNGKSNKPEYYTVSFLKAQSSNLKDDDIAGCRLCSKSGRKVAAVLCIYILWLSAVAMGTATLLPGTALHPSWTARDRQTPKMPIDHSPLHEFADS